MKCKILLFLFLLVSHVYCQDGGRNAFSFINIETSPRSEAMGGGIIAIYDSDLSLSQITPSLLNKSMDNNIIFSYIDYFSDINLFSFAYAKELNNIGVVSLAIKSINYGLFDLTNELGDINGNFSAYDQVLTLGIGKILSDRFSLGVNINVLNSQYDNYTSNALSTNISATYSNSKRSFTTTLLFKNIGRQITSYTDVKENLPYDIQLAVSRELAHLPFRYHISYSYLNRFDIKSPYKLVSQTNLETGEIELREETIAKTLLRHISIGGELNPFKKSLFLRGGFNFQRRFDLTLASYNSFVGFSCGLGFRISKIRFDYSRSSYHLSGAPNNFSIGINLSTFGL